MSSRRPAATLRSLLLLLLPLLPLLLHGGSATAEPPRMQLQLRQGRHVVVVSGIAAEPLKRLTTPVPKDTLSLYVDSGSNGGGTIDVNSPAVFGSLRRAGKELVFAPKYPLRAGVPYRAVLTLPGAGPAGKPVTHVARLIVPRAEQGPPTKVEAVYPRQHSLPENQLKFYLHFSAPMRQGEAYRHIRLLRDDNSEVDYPFLRLEPELWDAAGKRLTLLLDPGRVKRGLRPREELGQAIERGSAYRLVIDDEWRDAAGRPLKRRFVKPFKAVAADRRQPALGRWKVAAPSSGSRQPLIVNFDEPLDHAMLQRVLNVAGADGARVEGQTKVNDEATRWTFIPTQPWTAGRYELLVESQLEDLAGNSLLRPFEVDQFRQVKPRQVRVERLPLRIRPQ